MLQFLVKGINFGKLISVLKHKYEKAINEAYQPIKANTISNYFRNIFNSYARLPQDERERIIFKDELKLIESAINTNKIINIKLNNNSIELIPYKIVLGHFDLNIVVLDAIVYLLILFLITRTILKKYMTDVNTLEICMLVIIYLISLISGLESFQQSIALNLLLVIMILQSFFRQENNIFKCSSISFLVMVFVQTKALDFPIGWLICLLLFGLFFVTFATIDEIKKRK
mgnify:CR=1 FL=1